jgi:hypothetical protein
MNQILSFQTAKSSKEQIKKIIKFFSIFIILFSLVLIVEGVFRYKELKNNTKVRIDTPDISVEKNDGIVGLTINSKIGINEITYYWNDGLPDTIKQNGENEVYIERDIPTGTNELYLEIIDSQGNTIKYDPIKIVYDEETTDDEDWEVAVTKDSTKPTVTLNSANGKITINASDNVKMSYITYSWNGEEETKVTGLSDDEKSLTADIEVPKGNNKLTVKAYDKADNETILEKDVIGVNGPSISVVKENNQIIVNVEDELGITKITYNFNGEEKTIEDINETSYEFKLDLVDGENYIIVDAYNSNAKNEYKGKTKY